MLVHCYRSLLFRFAFLSLEGFGVLFVMNCNEFDF